MNEKYVATVRSLEGSYDLMVFISVNNYSQAQSFWHKTLENYGKYFSKRVFTAFSQEDSYAYRFLLDKKDIAPSMIHQLCDSGKRVEIDNLDYQIIKLIIQNARISTVDMAKVLDTTSKVIQYRLKKLLESGIIIAYRIHINFSNIGYYVYKVDVEPNQFDKIDNIFKYIKLNPNFICILKTIGYFDFEIVFYLNNSYQLNQIMEDISNKFPDVIKNYSYYIGMKTYKDYDFL